MNTIPFTPSMPSLANVLVVEDEYMVASELRLILQQGNYRVSGHAFSMSEAMELLQQERPDMVLLDIYLQGEQTGIDLARHLVEVGIPFVFISAYANASLLAEAKATQPYGYLVKPFREQDVLVTLELACYRHAQQTSAATAPVALSANAETSPAEIIQAPDYRPAARLAGQFLELLEQQFPVTPPQACLKLNNASDFAQALAVHVNHLNRAVRTATSRTTSAHITARIIEEAIRLLQHTDYNVSEIAYCLGFEYPTYFNNFFKKQTGANPLSYRNSLLA
ncbi:MAG: response regulator transcription factor [Janthinobacterium lividum]